MVQQQSERVAGHGGFIGQDDGFTLAELLIVIVIMAILAGVSIPRFADQLELARESVDISHLHSAYSAVKTTMLIHQMDEDTVFYYDPESGNLVSETEIIAAYSRGYMRGTRFGKAALIDTSDLPKNVSYTLGSDEDSGEGEKKRLPADSTKSYVIAVTFETVDPVNADESAELVSKIGFTVLPSTTTTTNLDETHENQGGNG